MSVMRAQVDVLDQSFVSRVLPSKASVRPVLRRVPSLPSRATRDALDVSLDDDELRAETELTVLLMIAANGSAESLSQRDVDLVLGTGH